MPRMVAQLGQVGNLSGAGLHKTHPHALALARRAATAWPGLATIERVGIAYTEADVATKCGLIALTVDALPPPGAGEAMRWHQLSDTLENVDPQTLAAAYAFTWQVLQEVDGKVAASGAEGEQAP